MMQKFTLEIHTCFAGYIELHIYCVQLIYTMSIWIQNISAISCCYGKT